MDALKRTFKLRTTGVAVSQVKGARTSILTKGTA